VRVTITLSTSRLPPEIRELRKHAPLNQIKSIAEPGRGPVTISAPDGAPVTDDERTHGFGGGGLGVSQTTHRPFEVLSPELPPIPGGMTDEQRYLFDVHGYCHLTQAIVGAAQRLAFSSKIVLALVIYG
jgi:hypothetical protein